MSTEQARDAALNELVLEVRRLRLVEERQRAEIEHLIETQRALEDSRDHYAELYDFSPVAWVTLDKHGAIENLNLVAVTLLNFGRYHLVGAPLGAFVVPDDRRRLMDHLLACQNGQEPLTCELRLAPRQGAPVPIRMSTRRRGGGDESYTSALLDMREHEAFIAERQRLAESESEARAANEAKDKFIAILSHELRTPLTPVLAVASAFAESNEVPAEMRSAFTIVQRNVMTEARLIDDLLDVARIARGRLRVDRRPVDAHRAVGDALETLAAEIEQKNLIVKAELEAPRAWINGDSTRLQQVIWNILRNAIKFTPAAGHVVVRTWNHHKRLIIEVSDTGRGIDSQKLGRLFEPFQQVTDESPDVSRGLGLGLSICRGILKQHDATIAASSQGRGKGARFVVEIDTIDKPTIPEARASYAPPPPGPKVRILLVEDHGDTAEILQLLLRRNGYEVQVAQSVQSALAVDRAAFDVLLSDVGLRDGTGLDLMRTLRQAGKVKGIALSGFGTDEDVRASKEAGFSAHITKPVHFSTLVEAIARLHAH